MRRRSIIPLSILAILAVSGFAGSRLAVPMARPDGQYVVIVPSHDLVVVRLGVTPDGRAWRLGAFLREVIDALGHAGQA